MPLTTLGVTIGTQLKYIRLVQGLTQHNVAELLRSSQRTVVAVEQTYPERSNMTLGYLVRYAKALGAEVRVSIKIKGRPKRVAGRDAQNASRFLRSQRRIALGKAPRWASRNGYFRLKNDPRP